MADTVVGQHRGGRGGQVVGIRGRQMADDGRQDGGGVHAVRRDQRDEQRRQAAHAAGGEEEPMGVEQRPQEIGGMPVKGRHGVSQRPAKLGHRVRVRRGQSLRQPLFQLPVHRVVLPAGQRLG